MNTVEKLVSRLSKLGTVDNDSEEMKLQKSLLVILSVPFIAAGVVWGLMYLSFGAVWSAVIPLSYAVFSTASLVYFSYNHRFDIYRFSQLLLILLLPFALMFSLGGFIYGSVVIIWSLLSPLGAMLFGNPGKSIGWLIAYIFLVILSFFLQPFLPVNSSLSATQVEMFFVINLSAVGALVFLMVFYFVGKKNFYQQRSESLLLNILPEEIARELKEKGSATPQQFSSVTIMFTDFENFTQLAEKQSPVDLVAEIDRYFSMFDGVISRWGLEKIKTIGDAYMCAGGLPIPSEDHAINAVRAALEIQQFVEEEALVAAKNDKPFFNIRIGIHTGTVVAGIVGDKKFAYDIWGDAVNIASRMESSGEAGKINLSGSTYELIKDQFHCTYRGKIHAKHKGDIDMYFVESQ